MNLSNVCIDADLVAKKDPGMTERKITDEDLARGARFKALRLSRGLTQEQVAERAKLPRDRVPKIECLQFIFPHGRTVVEFLWGTRVCIVSDRTDNVRSR